MDAIKMTESLCANTLCDLICNVKNATDYAMRQEGLLT